MTQQDNYPTSPDSHDDLSDAQSSQDSPQGLSLDSKQINKRRSKYQRIDDNLRQKLIDAVIKEGQMLKAAAKKFKINYSSAKSIFHTYRKEGRVNKKAVRERYIKKNGTSIKKIPAPSAFKQTDSSESPVSANLVKPVDQTTTHKNLSQIKENLAKLETHVYSPEVKNLTFTNLYPQTITPAAYQNMMNMQSYPADAMNSNMIMQGSNLLMHLYQKNQSMRMYEEAMKAQRTAVPMYPYGLDKLIMNQDAMTLSHFPNLMALQDQMRKNQLNMGALNPFQNPIGMIHDFQNVAPYYGFKAGN